MRAIVSMTAVAFVTVVLGVLAVPVLGDEAAQQVDTKGLPKLGDKWLDKNPFVGNQVAIDVGASAYNQNCARCHGLEMISGGIAPDLRHVPLDQEGDDLFSERMQKGATRNGTTMMPIFAGLLPQEALWSIRAFMVSKHIPD
jgi:cytochrome c-550 PedF